MTKTSEQSVLARESQHTQLPWMHDGDYIRETGPYDEEGQLRLSVAKVTTTSRRRGEVQANAEFIVRACNSHQALVEALQAIVEITKLPALHPRLKKTTYNELIWREAEQALRDAGVL